MKLDTRTLQGSRNGPLVLALRVFGFIDILSLFAVLMPLLWIEWGHNLVGLGAFPQAPIAAYLARSASALYSLHGVILIFMSFDPERYRPLIRFLSRIAICHGGLVMLIDYWCGLPTWWVLLEGPAFAATGAVLIVAERYGRSRKQDA